MSDDTRIEVVIKSRRSGKGRWYWLVDLQSEHWTGNRSIAKKYDRPTAEVLAARIRKKDPLFDIRIEPAVLTQVHP